MFQSDWNYIVNIKNVCIQCMVYFKWCLLRSIQYNWRCLLNRNMVCPSPSKTLFLNLTNGLFTCTISCKLNALPSWSPTTQYPTFSPSLSPSQAPVHPTISPSYPSVAPTFSPSRAPSPSPTIEPTNPSSSPTTAPSSAPVDSSGICVLGRVGSYSLMNGKYIEDSYYNGSASF